MNEKNYIRYRKLKAFGVRLCFHLCRIFPIRHNRISVCTFEGKGGFGCNRKYVVEELHKKDPNLGFVWLVNDMDKEFPDYIKNFSGGSVAYSVYFFTLCFVTQYEGDKSPRHAGFFGNIVDGYFLFRHLQSDN